MNHKNAFAISREPWIRVEVFVRIAALGLVLGLGCGDENPAAPVGLGIPGSSMPVADAGWPLHGGSVDGARYSALKAIDRSNVARLGPAWSYATGSHRGLEATPIVKDGILYATSTWSRAFALDAATGEEIWSYDPKVPGEVGRKACCDVVNRGVAVEDERVYLGALDGRLIALDAKTGKLLWEVQTVDPEKPYTITGAPRVVKDKVVIGNGGADMGVRGYVSAYDAETGELVWRFYTVPASTKGPHEHAELEAAAATWSPDSLFEYGLGGTVYDAMQYDPELELLYIGTGNASVYNAALRSPGGGDNLYLSSIVALKPDTGEMVWYFQTTPGEAWDFTATQNMILADLEIDGRLRKVLMQAPKNGFFYVLDRETGEFISGKEYALVNWASGLDPETGRPDIREEALWFEEAATVAPGPIGAHNWQPMSFHPGEGLVYIPAISLLHFWEPVEKFEYQPGSFNTGEDFAALVESFGPIASLRLWPCDRTRLLAWDPVTQAARWEVPQDTGVPGGVLSTAGGLVFQGNGTGVFRAYSSGTGEPLWSIDVGTGIMAPPVSYAINGEQYVVVLAGIGGGAGLHFEDLRNDNAGQVLAFKLGGEASLPAVVPLEREFPAVDVADLREEVIDRGSVVYAQTCMRCHGGAVVSSGMLPDLRMSSPEVHARWHDIVLGGTLTAKGMSSFADVISKADSEAIRAYVLSEAARQQSPVTQALQWAAPNFCLPVSWMLD